MHRLARSAAPSPRAGRASARACDLARVRGVRDDTSKTPARRRALAVAIGAALGAAIASALWIAWHSHRERSAGEVQVVGSRADVDALLEERARGAPPPPPLV